MPTTFLGMHFSQKLPNIIDMLKSGEKMNFSDAYEEIECPWCGTDLKLKEVDDINENTL